MMVLVLSTIHHTYDTNMIGSETKNAQANGTISKTIMKLEIVVSIIIIVIIVVVVVYPYLIVVYFSYYSSSSSITHSLLSS